MPGGDNEAKDVKSLAKSAGLGNREHGNPPEIAEWEDPHLLGRLLGRRRHEGEEANEGNGNSEEPSDKSMYQ